MKNKIILALLGQTRAWKATFIALLCKDFQRIFNIRTTITTEYCFLSDAVLHISEIDPYMENIMGSADGDMNKYNDNIEANKDILQNILHLEKINERTDLREYIEYTLKSLCTPSISDEDLINILTYEGIEKYIKKIQITLAPSEALSKVLHKDNLLLILRDTRDLLDISEPKSVPSLNDLGLDCLDGIIFFCSDSYPSFISETYGEVLKAVMKALPVFLIGKDPYLYYLVSNIKKTTDGLINEIQNRTNDLYKNLDTTIFGNTLKFFSEIGVTNNEAYYDTAQMEFLLPVIDSFNNYADVTALQKADDFKFLQDMSTSILDNIVSKIIDIWDHRFTILNDSVTVRQVEVALRNFNVICSVYKDWELFDQKDSVKTQYIRPVLQDKTRADINAIILDSSKLFLGKYNGITTQSNGKWRYPATIISAVSVRNIIMSFLDKFSLEDTAGVKRLSIEKMSIRKQTLYVRKMLQDYLYRYYTDTNATISGHLIIKRDMIVNSMKRISGEFGNTLDVFPLVVQDSIVTFIDYLKNKRYLGGK